ncbi:MAG: hypothetical protein KF757_05005 [Phycisphaeraceae bacterium]|nr:hypothetical protein [Phycisphaeraceae bacterium]MCW5763874.1 hypothetical protein [Phycisphaeraceae bacterium]
MGSFRVAAGNTAGLIVFEAIGQDSLRFVSSLPLGENARHIETDGTTAFVGAGSKVYAIDVSLASVPRVMSAVDVGSEVTDLRLRDGYLYVGTHLSGLKIINATVHDALAVASTVPIAGSIRGVAASLGRCYAVTQEQGTIIDVSNPASPVVLTSSAPGGLCVRMTATRAYVGAQNLRVLDISNPASPSILHELAVGHVFDMTSANGVLYLKLRETLYGNACNSDGEYDRWSIRAIDVSGAEPIIGPLYEPPLCATVRDIDFIDGRIVLTMSGLPSVIFVEHQGSNMAATGEYRHPSTSMIAAFDSGMLATQCSGTAGSSELRLSLLEFYGNAPLVAASALLGNACPNWSLHSVDGGSALLVQNLSNEPGLTSGYRARLLEIGSVSNAVLHDALAVGVDQNAEASAVVVDGPMAYVAESQSGNTRVLRVLNVADPENLELVATVPTPGNVVVRSLASRNGYLYGSSLQGLFVLDIADPEQPTVLPPNSLGTNIGSLTMSGDWLFALRSGNQLLTVRTSNPADLKMVGTLTLSHSASMIASAGDLVVAGGTNGVSVVDVSNRSVPRLVATLPGGSSMTLSEDGSYLYVQRTGGITKYDLASPIALSVASSSPTVDTTFGVTSSGDLAYVSDLTGGVRVFDVSNETSPIEIGAFDAIDRAYETRVEGDLAFVAAGATGLVVLDISNPAMPTLVGTAATTDLALGLDVRDGFAFVACRFDGLQIFDVSNPAAPVLVGSMDTPGNAMSVTVAGTLAYVADGSAGVHIIEVSNRSLPMIVGTYNTPSSARQVVLRGGVAFVPDRTTGLIALDVSEPSDPRLISIVGGLGDARSATLWGHRAFVADFDGAVHVVDVSDVWSMSLVETIATPGTPRAVSRDGERVYVADGDAGMTIIVGQTCWASPCPVDLTGDGVLDFFDVQMFLNAYSASSGLADWNNDGVIDFFDVQAFLGAFAASCP